MLKRSAVSAQQQEEQAVFNDAALELDRGLLQEQTSASSRGMSDTTATVIRRLTLANSLVDQLRRMWSPRENQISQFLTSTMGTSLSELKMLDLPPNSSTS